MSHRHSISCIVPPYMLEQITQNGSSAQITSGETGESYVCQSGREHTPYKFRDVPGPRTESARGRVPPGVRDGSNSLEGWADRA